MSSPVFDSTTYINVGVSCGVFNEVTPPDITGVYLYSGSTVLKNALATGVGGGYSASGTGSSANVVTISDYSFNVRFNASLVYGSAQARTTARYIIGSSDTTDINPTVANHENQIVTSASWGSWSSGSTIQVTYKETNGAQYSMTNNPLDTNLENALKGLLSMNIDTITGGTSITTYTQAFYLRKVTPNSLNVLPTPSGKIYLIDTTGSGSVAERDIESASVQANDIKNAQKFRIIVYTSETGKYSLKIGTGNNGSYISSLNIKYNPNLVPNYTVEHTNGSVYCFDVAEPTDEILTAPSFSTLIKLRSSNKYLVLEDKTTPKIKDYWTTGYTIGALRQNMMFIWSDLTPLTTTTINRNTEEINRWNLRDTAGNLDSASVVSLADDTAALTVGPNNNVNEGWAITAGGTLIYVRKGVTVGFVRVDASENVTFVAGSPTSAATDTAWTCIKCSIGGDGLCRP
jgi:hypothetical protein